METEAGPWHKKEIQTGENLWSGESDECDVKQP